MRHHCGTTTRKAAQYRIKWKATSNQTEFKYGTGTVQERYRYDKNNLLNIDRRDGVAAPLIFSEKELLFICVCELPAGGCGTDFQFVWLQR